jgi:hypothetical protein
MAASISFVQATGDASNASTYTFTNHPIGSASSDRIVIVGVMIRGLGGVFSPIDISSVTVGGNAATLLAKQKRVDDEVNVLGIYAIAVPSGTTATIVANLTQSVLRCAIHVYSVTGAEIVPHATSVDTDLNLAIVLPVVASGCAVAMSFDGASASTGAWSGLTERSRLIVEAIATTSAANNTATADPSKAVSITWSSVIAPVLVAASFAPIGGGGIIPILRQHYAAQGAR